MPEVSFPFEIIGGDSPSGGSLVVPFDVMPSPPWSGMSPSVPLLGFVSVGVSVGGWVFGGGLGRPDDPPPFRVKELIGTPAF